MHNQVRLSIGVTASWVGFHAWPKAPQEVSYLRDPHRHLFRVNMYMWVEHEERQLEFHLVQRDLKSIVRNVLEPLTAGCTTDTVATMSCETLAHIILGEMRKLGYQTEQFLAIVVSEDGENSACLTVTPLCQECAKEQTHRMEAIIPKTENL